MENVTKRQPEMVSRGKVTAKTQEYTPNATLIQEDRSGRETEITGPGKGQ